MTQNQKFYSRLLRITAITIIACISYIIVMADYGEQESFEFVPVAPAK